MRPINVVLVFERIGAEFTAPHADFAAGEDLEKIHDIDMSGRRLILSVWNSESYGAIRGYASNRGI